MRRCKILCTLGPSSSEPAMIEALVRAGMDAVRLNFSHGTAEEHRAVLQQVRGIADRLAVPLPVVQDLQGPKIRVGDLGAGGRELAAGEEVALSVAEGQAMPGEIPVSYRQLPHDVRPGDPILLDDGLLQLVVLQVADAERIRCRVAVGGRLESHKGINLPGVPLSTPSLTDKDRRDLQAGLEMGVDWVALSFVRRAEDVLELRQLLRNAGSSAQILAKIEKPEALEGLPAILAAADGIIVARGDLGVELPPQRVPLAQLHMVQDANAAGKLVVVATQMLDSMMRNPRPTRAEVSDVAGAVMQGADATMLSGETAVGSYPVEAVRMMAAIIEEVEAGSRRFGPQGEPALIPGIALSASAIGRAAVQVAADLDAACIATFTGSGRTAYLVSDYRPRQPILAFTPRPEVYRRLGLVWGVSPVLDGSGELDLAAAARLAEEKATRLSLVRPGERMVLTLSQPAGFEQQTNLLWVHEVR